MLVEKASPRPVFVVNNLRGIGWILLSVGASSAMTVAVRGAAVSLDSRMVVLLRASLTLVALLVAILVFTRLRKQLSFTLPWLHLSRGALIAVSTHLGFFTIASIPLATSTVLFFLAPVFATILSVIFQNEKVGPRRIFAILLGFFGAVVIMRPGFETIHPAMLTALASSLLFAGALIQSRKLAEADGSFSALVSSVVVTVIVSIPLAAPVFEMPSGWIVWAAVLLMVATGATRNISDIEAYRYAEAAVLAPFTYLRLILVGAAGYLIFGEIPDRYTLIGAVIIIAATLYIAQRERRLRQKATSASTLD